jgi:hypothetical protein
MRYSELQVHETTIRRRAAGCLLLWFSLLAYSSTLKMEAKYYSETLGSA